MSTTDLLIVGGGLAGLTVARSLRAQGDDRTITILAEERVPPYDRPPLSKQVLAGTMAADEISLPGVDSDVGVDFDVDLRLGVAAERLSPDALEVACSDGSSITASSMVIATGACARELTHLPRGTAGIHYLRTLDDALALRQALLEAKTLVVVGAGFIGLEVASTAAALGLHVTVVEAAAAPLTRVLGPEVGAILVGMHRDEGTDIRCGRSIVSCGDGFVVLDDGTNVAADLVAVGVGAHANTAWLEGSGLLVDDGVQCDLAGRTSRAGIWAVGDVARWPNAVTGQHVRVEQWQSALDQAQVVARALMGAEATWDSVPYFWSDQCGRKIQFAGRPGTDVRVVQMDKGPVALFGEGDTVVGALVTSNPRLLGALRKIIAGRQSWDAALGALG